MNIQQNLNAALALGAAAARTSDLYKRNADLSRLNKAEKATAALQKQAESKVQEFNKGELSFLTQSAMEGANKLNIQTTEELAKIKEDKAKLNPTQDNIKQAVEASDEPIIAKQTFELQQKKQASQEAMRRKKAEQQAEDSLLDEYESKENMMQSLKERNTFLENTVKEARDTIQQYLDSKKGGK